MWLGDFGLNLSGARAKQARRPPLTAQMDGLRSLESLEEKKKKWKLEITQRKATDFHKISDTKPVKSLEEAWTIANLSYITDFQEK